MRRSRSPSHKDLLARVVLALAQRNHLLVVMNYSAAREAIGGGHEGLRAVAEELGIPTLAWGLEVVVGDALMRSTGSLSAIEADLDGLANSYAPVESLKDDRVRASIEKLLPARRTAACSPRHVASTQEQAAVLALLASR